MRHLTIGLSVLAALWSARAEQPASPPPPKTYDAEIRYQIVAGRTERLARYVAMTRYLKSLGFVVDPNFEDDPRDPNETRLRGTLPSTVNRRLLFEDPAIQSVLLAPAGLKLPEDAAAAIKVQIELAHGLPIDRQNVFADQVRSKLAKLGFRDAVGYDSRGNTRLLGLIPRANLETLLQDLRLQPSTWLAPDEPVGKLPRPLVNVSPIRVIEVLGADPNEVPVGWGTAPDRVVVDPVQKLSPELRDAACKEANERERVEIFLTHCPGPDDHDWRLALRRAAPGLVIEGRLGCLVTAVASAQQATALAALPEVSGVRLPRPARTYFIPSNDASGLPGDALNSSGVASLHAQGHRGKGVRIAVIGGDFRGIDKYRGKQLPENTKLVDFTAERNVSLEPDPYSGDPANIGAGAHAALAASLAAPEAELILVRIDPAAPHQLDAVARLIAGEPYLSECITQRNDELRSDAIDLRRRRADLEVERKAVFSDFTQDDKANERRDAVYRKQADLEKAEKDFQGRQARFLDLVQAMRDLEKVRVAASTLVWESGYPVNGDGPLSRPFSDCPPEKTLWLQTSGNTRGQTWAGRFQDADGNGTMEFALPETSLRPDRWNRELNFFGWQQPRGEPVPDLPANTKVRLSVQWLEAHDASLFSTTDDLFRVPLADLRVVIVRQRDPAGARVSADELDVIARSSGLPQRLDNREGASTYEHVVEFTAEKGGRYAVLIQGRVPVSTRPASVPTLPAQIENGEIWPRLHVEPVDALPSGRPVFLDYPTDVGGLGIPADSRGLFTVGAIDRDGRIDPATVLGPALGRELHSKPDFFAPGVVLGKSDWTPFGSDMATPFAAGANAALLSSGMSGRRLEQFLRSGPGHSLRVD